MNQSKFALLTAFLSISFGLVLPVRAEVFTFGSGANSFEMEFVEIGSPGNEAAALSFPSQSGNVDYVYNIGKFEVSEEMIATYNTEYGIFNSLMIATSSFGPSKPALNISWNEAARFVNWLNTSTGGMPAYKFTTGGVNDNISLWQNGDAGYDPLNPYRNKLARFALPSVDEWFKAAYYDPDLNGGNGGYWQYPTGSDSVPTAVASGTDPNTAVYSTFLNLIPIPADVDRAGGLSPLGVMALGGNAFEWNESMFDSANDDPLAERVLRGGPSHFRMRSYAHSSLLTTRRPTQVLQQVFAWFSLHPQ